MAKVTKVSSDAGCTGHRAHDGDGDGDESRGKRNVGAVKAVTATEKEKKN